MVFKQICTIRGIMYNLNKKIVTLLKKHPEGGENFFNALDFMIRNDRNILEQYMNFITELKQKVSDNTRLGAIVSGAFGRALLSNYYYRLGDLFQYNIIVTNGGIRTGEPVEIYKDDFNCCGKFVLLDDSIYSGTTYKAIQDALPSYIKMWGAWVIYDGSKLPKEAYIDIRALFRYYE